MQTFLAWIDWGEQSILRWGRVGVVSAFGLLLVGGALVLLISLLRVSTWPDATLDDALEPVYFSAPDSTEQQASSPTSRIQPLQSVVQESQRYQDEVEDMLDHLMSLTTAVNLKDYFSRPSVEKYLHAVIDDLIRILAEHPTDSREERLERLDEAVENMVEYVEDMTDHYTEMVEEEENLSIRGQVQTIMKNPLSHYTRAFALTLAALGAQAQAEQSRVAETRAKGLAGFGMLSVIGLILMACVPLLVLLRLGVVLHEKS